MLQRDLNFPARTEYRRKLLKHKQIYIKEFQFLEGRAESTLQSAVVELKAASKWRRRTGAGYTSLDKITGTCMKKLWK